MTLYTILILLREVEVNVPHSHNVHLNTSTACEKTVLTLLFLNFSKLFNSPVSHQ